jgi:hypothetical protein
MRAFWLTLLAAGLLLVTIDTYEASQSAVTGPVPCLAEDGSGYPNPTPTPIAK